VLVVDDEASLRAALTYNLRLENYAVETASAGEEALHLALTSEPDLVILDVMLPGMDGIEVCRQIRLRSSVPILMLTARDAEIDRVVGLEIGADDYLTKPFSMRELVARVRAMLRRRRLLRAEVDASNRDTNVLQVGDVRLSMTDHEVTVAGREVRLKPKEFDLLAFLMRHPGQVFSAERLIERVWGYPPTGDTRTVAVHIRSLRRRIEVEPSRPRRIQTLRGVGYRFVA
jgi:DNA-binding response OmpR family regulator